MLHLRNLCLDQDHKDFGLFSRSFIVSGFTFRFMIHVELIFVSSVKHVSKFIFLSVMSSRLSTIG